ncbi:hypothetical protein Q5762_13945 [Streptomyces sp. P9(2023)]|uniref:hypothetical protein n=1 Tax=Streptomyces sp. P9(2023) TaxID=3064394 RepID=UPI0028F433E7|nr:hypothetical protein [Streptomyces sp. P9(2023)]MDT9689419.1 hypothetical protein [Streptomyces sp. P9(2023)]
MTSQKPHIPGQWPVTKPVELHQADDQGEQHLALVAVQARFHVTLGSIRADLEEQPSPMAVLNAARRWNCAITAMADEVASALKKAS